MGVLGCPDFYKCNDQFELNNNIFSNICSDCLYHGIDWIYTSVYTIYALDFRVWYFWFFNSIYDDSFDIFFSSFWYFSLLISSFQLFWAIMLDQYVQLNVYKLSYIDEWFKGILMSKNTTIILLKHPELIFLKYEIMNDFFFYFFGNFNFSIYEFSASETFFSPVVLYPQLLFLIFFSSIFICFYFSYFTSATREENTIDSDYLSMSASVEAEKEISSFDDMILAFVVLFYIFGWYFYIHCWSLLSIAPELVLVFYLFPALYYIIIGIPTFLIYDFGIYFLAYLRGVCSTSILIYELMFDYIGVVIFYTRILVQGVRLVLMISTYISMHDVTLYFSFGQKMFLGAETFWEGLNSTSITLDSMSYFFLFNLPGKFLYLIYEVLHTFFVVTVQFAAFFAIVFWLFLFLYTFFVIEKQENYFFEKRLFRKKLYLYLYSMK